MELYLKYFFYYSDTSKSNDLVKAENVSSSTCTASSSGNSKEEIRQSSVLQTVQSTNTGVKFEGREASVDENFDGTLIKQAMIALHKYVSLPG